MRGKHTHLQRGFSTVVVVVIAAAVLVGAGAVAYVMTDGFNFSKDSKSQANGSSASKAQTETKTDKQLVEAFLAGTTSITCTYAMDNGSTGKGYFKANRNYSIDQQSSEGRYRMVKLDDYGYIWKVGQKQGFKVDASAWDEQYKEQVPVFDTKTLEENAEGTTNIDCKQSSGFDKALFTVPSDVTFADPTANIPQQMR